MKINNIITTIALAASLTACSDFTETTPKGKVIPTTTEDFKEMAIDVTNSSTAYPLSNICSDDVYSDDQNEFTNYGKAYFWMEDFYKTNEGDEAWNATYKRIYVMNVVINNIMSSTEGTEAEKKAVLSEAKVWRAYYYWYLQSLYAKDYDESTASTDLSVPLSLTPDLEAELPRATVEEVTRQIWSDLEGAEDALPSVAANNYRPTKGAVYALKARILFYEHKYDEAAEQAKLALQTNSELQDLRTWSFKNENNPSSGINGKPTRAYQSPEKIWYMSNGFTDLITIFCISDDLQSLYQNGDLRFKFYFSNLNSLGEVWDNGRYRYLQESDYNFGVPEMMLIEAEALARKKDNKALDILNTIRQKRFADTDYRPLTTADGATLLDIVLDERRRELCLNSLRWLDMKRLAAEGKYTKTLTRTFDDKTYTLEPNSKLYVFPIPAQVLGLNHKIIPNDRKQ